MLSADSHCIHPWREDKQRDEEKSKQRTRGRTVTISWSSYSDFTTVNDCSDECEIEKQKERKLKERADGWVRGEETTPVTNRESPYTAAVRISLASDQRLKVTPTLAAGGVSCDTHLFTSKQCHNLSFKRMKMFIITHKLYLLDLTWPPSRPSRLQLRPQINQSPKLI